MGAATAGLALGQIGASIAGGVIAGKQSKRAQAAFEAAQAQAIAALEAVGIPSIEAQQIVLQNPQMVGELVPELQQVIEQEKSAMEGVQVPSQYKEAQERALDKLINMGETPFTLSEQIAQDQQRRETQGLIEQQNARNMLNAAQRGIAGSGLEFGLNASQAQQQQQALANASEAKMQQAQQRALESIAQAGSLGTQLSGQSFQQQSDVAKAKDIINQFNTQSRQGVQSANVAAQNAAKLRNLDTKQQLELARAQTVNTQEQYNKGLIQQDYQNRLAKAQAIANARVGAAGTAYQGGLAGAANTMGMYSGIGQAFGGIGQAFAANSGKQQEATPPKEGDADFMGPVRGIRR
jgi:hypothetical protein